MARGSALALLLAASGTLAVAQTPQNKDVEWVPTPEVLVEKILDMAKVTAQDYVIDLGSGDGRTVIGAAKRGARALGVEYDPDLVAFSKGKAQKEGVAGKATFVKADLFETDFSQATVLTLFLLPELNLRLRAKILNMKPGTRVVSTVFDMGEWKPDESATLGQADGCPGEYCTALLWIVPARVAGRYRHPQGSLVLEQTFQMLSGRLTLEDKSFDVAGRVRGEEIRFTAGGQEYTGKVNGKILELH